MTTARPEIRWIIAMGLCVCTAAGQPAEPAAGREADHESLRLLMARTTAAINAADVKALEACLASEFVFTAVDQTCITNHAQMAAYFSRLVQETSPVARAQVAPQAQFTTRFLGPDAGYCCGDSLDVYTLKNGRVFRIPSRWSAVVVRESGEWRAAVVHTGVNFVNNPVLAARSLSAWGKLGILLHVKKPPYERP